jgi:DNA repair protein RecO (recombination protein O)
MEQRINHNLQRIRKKMSESLLKGYLISKINYGIFDEIITILTTEGTKCVCLSKGSRKIMSKNGRNLFLGSFVEAVIFRARHENKVSRLKKIMIIDSVP